MCATPSSAKNVQLVEKLLRALFRRLFRGLKSRFCSILDWFYVYWTCFGTTDRCDSDFFNRLVRFCYTLKLLRRGLLSNPVMARC
jgi:hypothetical protein